MKNAWKPKNKKTNHKDLFFCLKPHPLIPSPSEEREAVNSSIARDNEIGFQYSQENVQQTSSLAQ